MSWLWALPVPILLVGLLAAVLLAKAAAKELERVDQEQAHWAVLGAQLADLRRRTDELGQRRQEWDRR